MLSKNKSLISNSIARSRLVKRLVDDQAAESRS